MNPILLIILIIVIFGGVGYGFRGGLNGPYMYGGGSIGLILLLLLLWFFFGGGFR